MTDLNIFLNLQDKRLRILETKKASSVLLDDITELDSLSSQFDYYTSRFLPTFNGDYVDVTGNPYRLLISVNGIIQNVSFPEYVCHSPLQKDGFYVDYEGYLAFSEAPLYGSTFNARILAGPTTNSGKKVYPFKPVDILLGA